MGCYGQDWASYQSPAPEVTGLSFVFVKATEGLTYVNPRRDAQVAYARLHKLVVGHYHYPHMANDPVVEADRFLAVARPQAGDVLALDWEGYDAANRGVSTARLIAYKNAFLSHLRGVMPQHQTGTYCNGDYLGRDPKGAYGDFLWIATAAQPAGQPGISHQWLFHQYGAKSVDKDFCPLSAAALKDWAHAKENDMTPAQAQQLADLHKALVERSIPTRAPGAKPASYSIGEHVAATNGRVFADQPVLTELLNTVRAMKTELDAVKAKLG